MLPRFSAEAGKEPAAVVQEAIAYGSLCTGSPMYALPSASVQVCSVHNTQHPGENLVDMEDSTYWWAGGGNATITIQPLPEDWGAIKVLWGRHADRAPRSCEVTHDGGGTRGAVVNLEPPPNDGGWHTLVARGSVPAGTTMLKMRLSAGNNVRVSGVAFTRLAVPEPEPELEPECAPEPDEVLLPYRAGSHKHGEGRGRSWWAMLGRFTEAPSVNAHRMYYLSR